MIKVRRVPLYLHVVVLARFSQQTFFLTKIQKLKHHGDAPPPFYGSMWKSKKNSEIEVTRYSPPQWIRIFMILRRMSSFFFNLFVCFKDFLEEFGIFRNDAIATCLLLQQLNKMDIMFMLIILTDFENIIIMISN